MDRWQLKTPKLSSEDGFTLLEILIAFTIAAVVLVSVFRATSTGLGIGHRARDTANWLLHAQSKLAEVGNIRPLEAGVEDGTLADGTAWRVTVEEAYPLPDRGDPTNTLKAFRVDVHVGPVGPGRGVSLTTLRLGG